MRNFLKFSAVALATVSFLFAGTVMAGTPKIGGLVKGSGGIYSNDAGSGITGKGYFHIDLSGGNDTLSAKARVRTINGVYSGGRTQLVWNTSDMLKITLAPGGFGLTGDYSATSWGKIPNGDNTNSDYGEDGAYITFGLDVGLALNISLIAQCPGCDGTGPYIDDVSSIVINVGSAGDSLSWEFTYLMASANDSTGTASEGSDMTLGVGWKGDGLSVGFDYQTATAGSGGTAAATMALGVTMGDIVFHYYSDDNGGSTVVAGQSQIELGYKLVNEGGVTVGPYIVMDNQDDGTSTATTAATNVLLLAAKVVF